MRENITLTMQDGSCGFSSQIERLKGASITVWDMGNDGIFKKTRLLDEKEAVVLYETMIQDLSEIMDVLEYDPEGLQRYSITHNAKEVRVFIEKERNVRRIYIGLESGSNRILSLIKKCNTAEDIIVLTNRIKEADIPVGIMLIAGLGGKGFYDEHVKESIRTINSLNLDAHDNIYFSHLFFHEKASYQDDLKCKGIKELTYGEENRQIQGISSGLGFASLNSPHIKGYEIRYVRF